MYYAMRASAPSLHRESTDSLIYLAIGLVPLDHQHISVYLLYLSLFCHVHHFCAVKPNNNNNNNNNKMTPYLLNEAFLAKMHNLKYSNPR